MFELCLQNAQQAQINTLVFPQGQKGNGRLADGNAPGRSLTSAHTCRTKDLFSSLCGDKLANIALRLPWTVHQKNLSIQVHPPDENISLVQLLVSLMCVNANLTFP